MTFWTRYGFGLLAERGPLLLAIDDGRLLATAQPEVREYRMRFWDKGAANGEWTAVSSATVSP